MGRARQIADTLLLNIGRTGETHVINEINGWFAPETNDRFIRITRGDGSVLYISKSPKDSSFDADQVPPLVPGQTGQSSWRKEKVRRRTRCFADCRRSVPFQRRASVHGRGRRLA